MRAFRKHWLTSAALLICSGTMAQVPPELADKLKAIGRVINPPATAALYESRVIEVRPYLGVNIERDIRYGAAERNLLDVFAGTESFAAPRPVLLFVHGGGFAAGNRQIGPNSPFYDNVMVWAVRNGMVGVNVTYRLAPMDPWPAGSEDVGQAVRWVHEQIAARGGDPRRIYLLGHSAGATHVTSYVANERFHKVVGSGLAGALFLSGIYRITPEMVALSPNYRGYFGNDTAKYEERSSVSGLLTTRVPLWVGSCELDPREFQEQARLLNDTLCKAGRCPAFVTFPGHSHMSEVFSIHTDDRSVGDALLEFIRPQRR